MAARQLTDRPLHVEAHLVGAPLASPLRRSLAFGIDGVLLIVPTVVVSLAVAGAFLWTSDRPAFQALLALKRPAAAGTATTRHQLLYDLAPLLVRLECRGLPAAAIEAVEAGERDRAADILAGYEYQVALRFSEGEDNQPLAPRTIRVPVERLIPPIARGMALFVVPAIYFALFTCSRLRATPGKRCLGLRVVRLDGEPLTLLEGLERFVGYLHIPATLFVSLLDFWRDPNRRLPHDRVVHTAVIRAVSRRRAAAGAKTSPSIQWR